MRKDSPYYSLEYLVQCKWPHNSFWETICAFNHKSAATVYQHKCQKFADNAPSNKMMYRVITRNQLQRETKKLQAP